MINNEQTTLPIDANVVALKSYRHITNEWQVSAEQSRKLLSCLNDKQFEAGMSGNLNSEQPDLLILVSHMMAIYKILHQLFRDPTQANAWMTKPNEHFQHRSCIGILAEDGIDGALEVRRYLELQIT